MTKLAVSCGMNTDILQRLADKVASIKLSARITIIREDKGEKWAVRRIDGPAFFLHEGKWRIASSEGFLIPFVFTFAEAVAAGEIAAWREEPDAQ